jgi:hypothetical protein
VNSCGRNARHVTDSFKCLCEELMRGVGISESLTGGLHLHRQEI